MAKWKQVEGDRDFAGVGCTLARDQRRAGQVELVRITPWLEMDSSALRDGYGFWDVSSKTVDYSDLAITNRNVMDAMKSAGLDVMTYKRLSPAHKAAMLAEHEGYEESTSTSDFGKALPAPIGEVEFYAGKSREDVADINRAMRREVVQKLYGGRPSKVPPEAALELALGGEPLSVDLDDDQTQATRYSLAAATCTWRWPEPKADDNKLVAADASSLRLLLAALLAAPASKDLEAESLAPLQLTYMRDFELDWEDKGEQVRSMIDDDSRNARELARDILGDLGF
jgi:hypothetical protein